MATAGRKGAVGLTLLREEDYASFCNTTAGCVTSEISSVPKHDLYLSKVLLYFQHIDAYLSQCDHAVYTQHTNMHC